MPIARHPPHGPVRALLTHTVLTLDISRRSAHWDKGVGYEPQEAKRPDAQRNVPRSNDYADFAAEAVEATYVAPLFGTHPGAPSYPESHGIGNIPAPLTAAISPFSRSPCAGALSV